MTNGMTPTKAVVGLSVRIHYSEILLVKVVSMRQKAVVIICMSLWPARGHIAP